MRFGGRIGLPDLVVRGCGGCDVGVPISISVDFVSTLNRTFFVILERWRCFLFLRNIPLGVLMRYDLGSSHFSVTVAVCHRLLFWSCTRTSCPGDRGGKSWACLS